MKKPQIAILQGKTNLIGLSTPLTRMGFSGEFFSGIKAFQLSLQKSVPDLLLVDVTLTDKHADNLLLSGEISEVCPVLLVEKGVKGFLLFDRQNKRRLHLVDLHAYFLQNLKSYSRKKLRLAVKLPSLLSHKHSSQYSSVSCLGTGGAFVKTGHPAPEEGQLLQITISLLGHHAELDVCGRVLYSVSPCLENNYIQGVGVRFEKPDKSSLKVINDYLTSSLLEDPSIKCTIERAAQC